MREFWDHPPPIGAWYPGLFLFTLFIVIEVVARRRQSANATAYAFAWIVGSLAAFTLLSFGLAALSITWLEILAFCAGATCGVLIFGGAVAGALRALRGQSLLRAVACTLIVALISYPFALVATAFVACHSGAGCI